MLSLELPNMAVKDVVLNLTMIVFDPERGEMNDWLVISHPVCPS